MKLSEFSSNDFAKNKTYINIDLKEQKVFGQSTPTCLHIDNCYIPQRDRQGDLLHAMTATCLESELNEIQINRLMYLQRTAGRPNSKYNNNHLGEKISAKQ